MIFSSPDLSISVSANCTCRLLFDSGLNLRNYWLLLASLVFFAWGGVSFTAILLISIGLNYLFGLKIQHHKNNRKSYWWLFAGVSCNLLILGIFKYANFLIRNINELFDFISVPEIPADKHYFAHWHFVLYLPFPFLYY